ncbi:MraY family glycosyltransferase [Lysobacter xanthus]
MSTAILLLLVAAISAIGTGVARAYALRRQLVDQPGARRSHAEATPRGGGAGPVAALLLALAWPGALGLSTGPSLQVAAAMLAVALMGGWDDHRPLPASWRLIVHVAAGVLVAAAFFDAGRQTVEFIAAMSAVVVLVNVWNFMDGINGIAATQVALFAGGATLLLPAAPLFVAALAVACLAFLPWNFPRARVFLGDVGSGPLGLAVAVAWVARADGQPGVAVALALPASGFLVDAGMTLLRRFWRRERWWEPHTQHLYQALARRFGHTAVTLAYAAWTAAALCVGLAIRGRPTTFIVVSVAVWYTAAAALWVVLQQTRATRALG